MVELESSTSKVAQLQIGKSKYLIYREKCVEHGHGPVQKDQRNQSYYLFLNQQMKNSPQGFARSVMLASVDKCS